MYVCVCEMIDSEVIEVIEGIDSWWELRTNGNNNYEEQKRPVASKKRYCMNIETLSRQIIHVTINEKKMIAKYCQAENVLQMNQEKKHVDLIKHTFPLESHEVNYGGPESFFNTLLDDVNLLGHNATLPSKDARIWFSIDLLEERPAFTMLVIFSLP